MTAAIPRGRSWGSAAGDLRPAGGGPSTNEIRERDVESVCDTEKVAVARVVEATFDSLDGGAVDAGPFGELLLCEVSVKAPVADACTEGSAGIGDPLRMVCGRHPTHARCLTIIRQQLLCRFS